MLVAGMVVMGGASAWGVREGGANGEIIAQRWEEKGELAKAAMWWEAVATTMEAVSKPLAMDQIQRAEARKDVEKMRLMQQELKDVEAAIIAGRRRATADRARAKADEKDIDEEKVRVGRFLEQWVPYYPRALAFSWGRDRMQTRARDLAAQGRTVEALKVQEEHWRQCADWYEITAVKYYETRDAARCEHFKEVVSLLRAKAELYRKKGAEPGLDIGESVKRIEDELAGEGKPGQKLNLAKAIEIARKDERVARLGNARFTGWYQGACWLVMIQRGEREIGRVEVDDETGKVVDVRVGE